ncbi:THAP domain-containing protein 8, partial [Austrofundulus limnaeus]|uniref:THAP domain-containing protein 8 n=1 Tax=Austrofundulus limnaeus TaxID=52670 RepID=A0A2I4CKU4_AUSLI
MGRENWTPSRHQYICNEHFSPSCFRVRWGVRYLEADAVPTVFQQNQKRKAADQTEKKPKRLRPDPGQSGSVVLDGAEVQDLFHTVHLYEVSVDQSQPGDFSLTDSGAGSLQTDLDPRGPAEGEDSGLIVPLTFCQTADDPTNTSELVLVSETQTELVKRITAAVL